MTACATAAGNRRSGGWRSVMARATACLGAATLVSVNTSSAIAPPAIGLQALDIQIFRGEEPWQRRQDRLSFAPGLIRGFDHARLLARDFGEAEKDELWPGATDWRVHLPGTSNAFDPSRFRRPGEGEVDTATLLRHDPDSGEVATAEVDFAVLRLARLVQPEENALAALERAARWPGNDTLRFGPMAVPRALVDTVMHASIMTDVDPVYMMALADKESSFLPEVRASTSTAEGLYQFIESTWFEVVRVFGHRHGLEAEATQIEQVDGRWTVSDPDTRQRILALRRDPYLAAALAAEMKRRDAARVSAELGRALTNTEFYLLHFFGVDAAARFMRLRDEQPTAAAARVFPAAARANRALFFKRVGRRTQSVTIAEFYERIEGTIGRRLMRYDVMRPNAPDLDQDSAQAMSFFETR